jgi:hypothetical protein
VMVLPWVTELVAVVKVEIEVAPEEVSPVDDEEAGSKLEVGKEVDESDSDVLQEEVDIGAEAELDPGIPAQRIS